MVSQTVKHVEVYATNGAENIRLPVRFRSLNHLSDAYDDIVRVYPNKAIYYVIVFSDGSESHPMRTRGNIPRSLSSTD